MLQVVALIVVITLFIIYVITVNYKLVPKDDNAKAVKNAVISSKTSLMDYMIGDSDSENDEDA